MRADIPQRVDFIIGLNDADRSAAHRPDFRLCLLELVEIGHVMQGHARCPSRFQERWNSSAAFSKKIRCRMAGAMRVSVCFGN